MQAIDLVADADNTVLDRVHSARWLFDHEYGQHPEFLTMNHYTRMTMLHDEKIQAVLSNRDQKIKDGDIEVFGMKLGIDQKMPNGMIRVSDTQSFDYPQHAKSLG